MNEVSRPHVVDPVVTLKQHVALSRESLEFTGKEGNLNRLNLRSSHKIVCECLQLISELDPGYTPLNRLREYLNRGTNNNLGFATVESYYSVLTSSYDFINGYVNGRDIDTEEVVRLEQNGYETLPKVWQDILKFNQ